METDLSQKTKNSDFGVMAGEEVKVKVKVPTLENPDPGGSWEMFRRGDATITTTIRYHIIIIIVIISTKGSLSILFVGLLLALLILLTQVMFSPQLSVQALEEFLHPSI